MILLKNKIKLILIILAYRTIYNQCKDKIHKMLLLIMPIRFWFIIYKDNHYFSKFV